MMFVAFVVWIAAGAWLVLTPFGRSVVQNVLTKLGPEKARVVAPLGLAMAAVIAVVTFVLLGQPWARNGQSLTPAAWAVATVFGALFTSLETFSAMLIIAALARTETKSKPSASNQSENEK